MNRRFLLAVFLVSLGWALVASHGVALWDDDYTGWFRYALPRSLPRLIWEWLSPVPTRPEGWAFQNRPAQALIYKLVYLLFGYRAAAFFVVKSLFWAGLVTLDSAWVLRASRSRAAALIPPLLLLSSPSVMASFIWHADYGLLAECALSGALLLCFTLWESDSRRIDIKWILAFILIYLGYGTKAHVKCIPLVLLAYQALCVRRRAVYWLPLGALALAIPWSVRLLGETAPWWPGSRGSPTGWMTQAWSARRAASHLAAGFSLWPRQEPQSLLQELGPTVLLVIALGGALILRWREVTPAVQRAIILVLLWLAAVVVVTGALPDLPSFFSVRYGLLLISPASVLLGLVASHALSWLQGRRRIWLGLPAAALVATLICNGVLAVEYRDSLGAVTRAIDAAYAFVDGRPAQERLVLLPDFLAFDYRPGSSLGARRQQVASLAEAEKLAPLHPWALSWAPQFSPRLGLVHIFDGCLAFALHPRQCAWRAYLYRIEETPSPEAPSLLSRFQDGLSAAAAGDDARFLAVFAALDRDAPTVQVRYNYALALERNHRLADAVREWKWLVDEGVRDRGTLLNALEAATALPDPAFMERVRALL